MKIVKCAILLCVPQICVHTLNTLFGIGLIVLNDRATGSLENEQEQGEDWWWSYSGARRRAGSVGGPGDDNSKDDEDDSKEDDQKQEEDEETILKFLPQRVRDVAWCCILYSCLYIMWTFHGFRVSAAKNGEWEQMHEAK